MIRLSRAAAADLRSIDAWLRPKAGAAVTDRVLDVILSSIERLERFPKLGSPGRRADTRELGVSRYPYVVIYQLVGNDVVIVRVLHTRQQWPQVTG